MKTTPNFGFQVAEPTDPVKQYPTAVDDPFKTTLDTLLGPVARDTGWRNITSSLINGWVAPAGMVSVRRLGGIVYVAVVSMSNPSATPASRTFVAAAPAGFKNIGNYTAAPFVNAAGATADGNTFMLGPNTTSWLIALGTYAANRRLDGMVSFATSDPWPANLPGTPALLRDVLPDVVAPFPETGEGSP